MLYISRRSTHIPRFSWDSSVAIRVAPLSIVYMCVIIFNPLFLRHVEATAYHFSHSLSIAFSLIFSFYMLQVEPSQNLISACIIIMLGFCIGSMGQLNFSLAGVFYALAWPAVVAIYGIYVKKTVAALRNDVWLLIQYNTAMSIATLIPLVLLSGELKEVLTNVWFLDEFGFWLQMVSVSVYCLLLIKSSFMIYIYIDHNIIYWICSQRSHDLLAYTCNTTNTCCC